MAQALGVQAGQVAVRGTTTEGMGFTGRAEGILAQAVALLVRPAPE
jgi:2C-methyl-D-erythritol 2,4-cyclodiphosphate synthase